MQLKLHPSIRDDTFPEIVEGEFSEVTILQAILSLLEDYPKMQELVVEGSKIHPGLLLFSGKTELTSMGLLDTELDEDLTIRVVPILHGG